VPELARGDPWRESLERSLERRRKHPERSAQPRRSPARREAVSRPGSSDLPPYWRLCGRAVAKHWMTLIVSAGGALTLALLATTHPRVPVSQLARVSPTAERTSALRSVRRPPSATTRGADSGRSRPAVAARCRPSADSSGYVNPLARAAVAPRRIDQGVDYAGSGTLIAIGAARITHVGTGDTGWPGAFIEYRLLGGPEAGCWIYYAEGVTPFPGLNAGETVRAGQAIATIVPNSLSGIEIGWGAGNGTESYAAANGQWSEAHEADDIPSASGLYFSSLIAALGGPPGLVEG
jgi:hypothetical protein